MSGENSQIERRLKLKDDEYFTLDEQGELALQTDIAEILTKELLDSPPLPGQETEPPAPLIATGAPEIVDLEQRDELPLVLALHYTGLRQWQVDPVQNTRILAVDLNNGRLRTARLFIVPGKRLMTPEPSMSGSPPDSINSSVLLTSVRRYNLRRLLDLEWQPARLALTVIAYDCLSNSVITEFRQERPESREIRSRRPSDFITIAIPDNDPPVPADQGVLITVPENASPGAPVPIQIAIKLPAGELPIAPAAEPAEGSVLLASLLLFQLDGEFPFQVDLAIPTTLVGPSSEARDVQVAFGFDLNDALPLQELSGAYQAYLAVGSHVVGPHQLTIDSE